MQIDVQRQTLRLMAAATWQSFVALTRPNGLPADHIQATGEWANYTSPTNIGAYLWSTLVARDLEIITATEAYKRIRQTLATVAKLERHEPSGQFYNWYSTDTGAKLTIWPPTGHVLHPFLSSVDNGWLATALIMVANGMPELRDQANALLDPMDFGFYYDPAAGLLRGGYWPEPPNQCHTHGYTRHHYGALNTETRIASYIGIARGQIPATHYFKLGRTIPETCAWDEGNTGLHGNIGLHGNLGLPTMQPHGGWKNYLGVDVFEGCYSYMGLNLVPSWGGSMFEALMVPLFVPEETWGPRSWGINHPLYVQAQILHGLGEAQYGYWGFSPANNPSGGYREYGVDGIGMLADGYASNNDNTLLNYDFPNHKGRTVHAAPPPSAYTNGVVTPHAVFLALNFAPEATLANLSHLCRDFPLYGPWGFWDSVNVETGEVSTSVLALDQGMIMMALGNALSQNCTQSYFTKGCIEEALRPLLALETFTAGASVDAMPDVLLVDWPIAREHAFVTIHA